MLKRHKAPAHVQQAIDSIIRDLEIYGRTTTTNGKASRFLSYRMRYPKKLGQIYIQWLPKQKCSLIALEKDYKIEVISPNKIRLIYEGTLSK